MYSLQQLKKGLANPSLTVRELNRQYFKRVAGTPRSDSVSIMDEDWDNLLLLDACRYDMFQEISSLPGDLTKVTSGGSNTIGFLKHNFDGRTMHDTVYITANPQLYRNRDSIDCEFHATVNVWSGEGWDDDLGTVRPETVADRTREIAREYPHKRLLVHFIQPHFPFLTEETTFDKNHLGDEETDELDFWSQILMGNLSVPTDRIWELYRENLAKTLPHVEALITDLEGLTVVSSDHGNMVGERSFPIPIREWGHPENTYTKPLVEVPWLECKADSRKTVTAQAPQAGVAAHEEDIVIDRLEQLGYKQ